MEWHRATGRVHPSGLPLGCQLQLSAPHTWWCSGLVSCAEYGKEREAERNRGRRGGETRTEREIKRKREQYQGDADRTH